MKIEHRNYKIQSSGKRFFKMTTPDGTPATQRVMSIEAAKAYINSVVENRVMTPAEHALVHPNA